MTRAHTTIGDRPIASPAKLEMDAIKAEIITVLKVRPYATAELQQIIQRRGITCQTYQLRIALDGLANEGIIACDAGEWRAIHG